MAHRKLGQQKEVPAAAPPLPKVADRQRSHLLLSATLRRVAAGVAAAGEGIKGRRPPSARSNSNKKRACAATVSLRSDSSRVLCLDRVSIVVAIASSCHRQRTAREPQVPLPVSE